MADIVLKDRDGNDVPYYNVFHIQLPTIDGGVTLFSQEGEGYGKPIIATGHFTPTSTTDQVVEHNLGVPPDIILLWCDRGTDGTLISTRGYSRAFKSSLIDVDVNYIHILAEDGSDIEVYPSNAIDESTEEPHLDYGQINNATPEIFNVGGTNGPLSLSRYNWFAIGGLVDHNDILILTLSLYGDGNLIVTGGVPEIQQLNLYADGEYLTTVDYNYSREFIIPISEMVTEFKPYTFSIEVIGEGLSKYKYIYSKPVTGWVSYVGENVVAYGDCGDNAHWAVDSNGLLTVLGRGSVDDYESVDLQPWYSYAENIKTLAVKDGITRIGNNAFARLSITSYSLPNTLTTLGMGVFELCTGLTDAIIPDSVISMGAYPFASCSNLKTLTLSENISSLPIGMATYCNSLANVTIPEGVTSILDGAFGGCTSLTNITIPEGVTSIGELAFGGCPLTSITIPEKVSRIRINAFAYSGIVSAIFDNTSGWWVSESIDATSGTVIDSAELSDPNIAATYLTSTYASYYWGRN